MESGAAPQPISLAGHRPVVSASVDPTYKIAAEVAENQVKSIPDNEWHSANRPGLVFELCKMSKMALIEAQEKFPEPKVPLVEIKEDDRWEPNPHDPEYRKALTDYVYERYKLIVTTCLVLGSKIKHCPDDLDKPEDTDWIEKLAVTGFVVPDNKWAKYVAWARMYALDGEEVVILTNMIQRYNGFTREADVEAAVDTFPSESPRDTDRTDGATEGRELGDNDRDGNTGVSS